MPQWSHNETIKPVSSNPLSAIGLFAKVGIRITPTISRTSGSSGKCWGKYDLQILATTLKHNHFQATQMA
jgi:hypothetical protein